MKIERLELNGFGRLRGYDLKFSPTINVIAGPNEAGKSTLAEAMQAILFGLTDHAAATAPNKLRQQFKPWSGGLFGGSLWVRLEDEQSYRIVRDFAGPMTKVYREPGATDVTNQYASG
ncbi:MAG TPA: AAA family ATPase, partial [Chloroflexota bacterium]|nr:AAA family ATPase [Chloroflexota bacterium]